MRLVLIAFSLVVWISCFSNQAYGKFGIGLKLLGFFAPQLYVSNEIAPEVRGELGISNGGFVTPNGVSLSAGTRFVILKFELFKTPFRPFVGTNFFMTLFNSEDSVTTTYWGLQALVGIEFRGLVDLPVETFLEMGASISLPFRFSAQTDLGFRFDF